MEQRRLRTNKLDARDLLEVDNVWSSIQIVLVSLPDLNP